jgi:phosphatidylinositol glycan class B
VIKDLIRVHGRTLLICIAISLALHITAAWKSAIYLHPDEYYQIVEFASYKMHITTADQMPWEFGDKIRPAFQPVMCYMIFKVLNHINITDRYTQLFVLRLLSAFFLLFCVTLFCVSSMPSVNEKYRRIYIIALYGFWYPYTYGAHFSSETWSCCMLLIAISSILMYYEREEKKPMLFFSCLGLLLGTAFLLRFQTAFISMGILAWLLIVKKEKFSALMMTV